MQFLKDLMALQATSTKITEAVDLFPDLDVIKLDPDRTDVYDLVHVLMPTIVRMAYTNLMHDKAKYERTHTDEEDEPFEFNKDALEDKVQDVVRMFIQRLDDFTSHDIHSVIDAIASEFKEPLTESLEEAACCEPHLAPRTSSKSKSFDSKFQFDGYIQGQHGVPKKQKGKNGKTYYMVGQKVAAVWDGLLSTGTVYEKSTLKEGINYEEAHKKIADGLKPEAKYGDFTTDDHAIYGYVKSRDNKKLFINVIDPTGSGTFTLEVSRNNGKSNFFTEDDLSATDVVSVVSRICRHPEEY